MNVEHVPVILGKLCLTSAGWFFSAGGGMAGAKPETQGTGFFMLIFGLALIIAGAFL